jgi:hypothetical protein
MNTEETNPSEAPEIEKLIQTTIGPQKAIVYHRFTPKVGDLWEKSILNRDYKIAIHQIENTNNGSDPRVDIEIITGTSVVFGGEYTERIRQGRYWLKRQDNWQIERCSLYDYGIDPREVAFFCLYVDHINLRSEEVTLVVCVVRGCPASGD